MLSRLRSRRSVGAARFAVLCSAISRTGCHDRNEFLRAPRGIAARHIGNWRFPGHRLRRRRACGAPRANHLGRTKPIRKVRLVSGAVTQDGSAAPYAAIQLRMDPGWKTYWRNPGDSGVPPSFDWSGSKNLKSAEVLYPAPHRFADANGTAIGYKDEVVFPVKITPEHAGEPVDLALTFEYGLCKDLCIPNSASLNVVLPPDLGKGDAVLIDTALSRVPKPEAGRCAAADRERHGQSRWSEARARDRGALSRRRIWNRSVHRQSRNRRAGDQRRSGRLRGASSASP